MAGRWRFFGRRPEQRRAGDLVDFRCQMSFNVADPEVKKRCPTHTPPFSLLHKSSILQILFLHKVFDRMSFHNIFQRAICPF